MADAAPPPSHGVTIDRNASGTVIRIEVWQQHGRLPRVTLATFGPEGIDDFLARARDFERSDPYSDKMPSDDAMVAAVLDDLAP